VQISGQSFPAAAERHFDAANFVVRELNVLGVAGVLFVVERDVIGRVLEDRPLRAGVKMRREEITFTRGTVRSSFSYCRASLSRRTAARVNSREYH